jgi:hypothetical protein
MKAFLIVIIAISLLTSCKQNCAEDMQTYSYSATIMDTDIQSTHFQDNVAAFNVSVIEKQNVDNECKAVESTANLVVQNLTNETITFSYTVTWNGYSNWSTSGNVTIPPNGSIDKGAVNHSATGYAMNGILTATAGPISYQ